MVHLIKLLSRSAAETTEVGHRLGRSLSPGDVVALTGMLGSGKSVLARGILRGLGISGAIPSPSFIVAASYEGRLPVNHIDLYRLATPDEAIAAGVEDLVYSGGVSVIEWAEKIWELLPPSRIEVTIEPGGAPDERMLTISPCTSMKERLMPFARSLMGVSKS